MRSGAARRCHLTARGARVRTPITIEFEPGRSFCVEFACSPCGSVGSLRVLCSPTVQRHAAQVNWRPREWLSVSICALR